MSLLHKSSNIFATCMQYVFMVGQTATKLPALFQPYLLQVMYMTFQYLAVSCIPAIQVMYRTFLGIIPEIYYGLQLIFCSMLHYKTLVPYMLVRYLTLIEAGMHFLVLYLGRILYRFHVWYYFPGRNFMSLLDGQPTVVLRPSSKRIINSCLLMCINLFIKRN